LASLASTDEVLNGEALGKQKLVAKAQFLTNFHLFFPCVDKRRISSLCGEYENFCIYVTSGGLGWNQYMYLAKRILINYTLIYYNRSDPEVQQNNSPLEN
jgi:hypothetical protein